MGNEIQIFNYSGKEIRTVIKDGDPWWVLKDVCDVLGVGNSRDVAKRLDEDEKADVDLIDTSSNGVQQSRKFTIINESGLYNVILRSDKPEAKAFKRWITHEVLPAIRKHGCYLTPQKTEELITNPDLIIDLANALKAERSQKEKLKLEADKLSQTVNKMKPKALFADAVTTSEGTILIGELAKILKGNGVDIGQKRLFAWMREKGYLIKREGGEYNMPTQKSMELGLFKIKETAITHSDGHISINKTPKITGKGQQYFINLFLESVILTH